MDALYLGALAAFNLGILTAISPCPLATNIAAISFIGRGLASPRQILLTGALYTLGRTITYVVLGTLITSALLSAPYVSIFLQKYLNKALGPALILVGMLLLGLISFAPSGRGVSDKTRGRVERSGVWGGAILGVVFALSFCPVSAALFFASLVPLALKYDSQLLLPSLYGLGTGLPVLAFAVLLAVGTRWVAAAFNRVTAVERWARRVTGVIFILLGIYFSLVYVFGVLS